MANRSDIFSRLQSYEVSPPQEAFQLLQNRLLAENAAVVQEGVWHGLQQLSISPPEILQEKITQAIAALPSLICLQQVAILPPTGVSAHIQQQLFPGKKQTGKQWLQARWIAAACLVLALAGWGIYYLGTVKQTLPVQQPVVQAPVATPRSQIAEQPADSNAAIVKKVLPQYKDYDNNSNVNFFKNNRFKTEGAFITITDNDFVVTFASFSYDELPAFLTSEENKEQFIRLDQYSYFTISENMVAMLKKMYQTKSKGTPTRRARKEKEKLEQWKKADEKRFDLQKGNPMDPIDLGDFLFK